MKVMQMNTVQPAVQISVLGNHASLASDQYSSGGRRVCRETALLPRKCKLCNSNSTNSRVMDTVGC